MELKLTLMIALLCLFILQTSALAEGEQATSSSSDSSDFSDVSSGSSSSESDSESSDSDSDTSMDSRDDEAVSEEESDMGCKESGCFKPGDRLHHRKRRKIGSIEVQWRNKKKRKACALVKKRRFRRDIYSCASVSKNRVVNLRLCNKKLSVVTCRGPPSILSVNVGNLDEAGGGGSSACPSIPYRGSLCKLKQEESIAKRIRNLKPDIVGLLEVFDSRKCNQGPNPKRTESCYHYSSRRPFQQARRLVGSGYTILCPAIPDFHDCLAVKKDIPVSGCSAGQECLTGLKYLPHPPACNPNLAGISVIGYADLQVSGKSLRYILAHPNPQRQCSTDKCLVAQYKQTFENLPAAGKVNIMAGDFNTDPYRLRNLFPSAKYLYDKISSSKWESISGRVKVNGNYGTTFVGAATLDHIISERGGYLKNHKCYILGVSGGTSRIDSPQNTLDHRAVYCAHPNYSGIGDEDEEQDQETEMIGLPADMGISKGAIIDSLISLDQIQIPAISGRKGGKWGSIRYKVHRIRVAIKGGLPTYKRPVQYGNAYTVGFEPFHTAVSADITLRFYIRRWKVAQVTTRVMGDVKTKKFTAYITKCGNAAAPFICLPPKTTTKSKPKWAKSHKCANRSYLYLSSVNIDFVNARKRRPDFRFAIRIGGRFFKPARLNAVLWALEGIIRRLMKREIKKRMGKGKEIAIPV